MARTKQSARLKGPSGLLSPPLPTRAPQERSTLLQLMGFSKFATDAISSSESMTAQLRPNWPAVLERLQSHPNEATIMYRGGIISSKSMCPLYAALSIDCTDDPLTEEVAEALVRLHPQPVTHPRSSVISLACDNPNTRPEVIDVFLKANPTYLCGRERTRTFQIMGFPAARHERPERSYFHYNHIQRGKEVDWEALEDHLATHPEEAKILNPECDVQHKSLIFPLEASLHFVSNPVPLSTVQLLLRLCPEAATISDSSVLYMACVGRSLENPEVIRTILRANPSLAASQQYYINTSGELGLPITEAVHLPCAAEIVPDLIRAAPSSLSSVNQLGETPLQVASQKVYPYPMCSTDLLRVLLEEGHRQGVGADAQGQLHSTEEYSEYTAMEHIIEHAMMYQFEERRDDTPWQNLCLCLKAAGAFCTKMSADDMWSYPLLHGAIEFGQNQVVFEKIFHESTTCPDVIRRDAMGRTPLRVAMDLAGDVPENYDRREEMCIGTVIEFLLDDHQGGSSESASSPVDSNGTLPLHYALKHGMDFKGGLRHIANAFSGALSIPDNQTKLIPCLLAAVGARARVDTIFALIVERINLIVNLIGTTLKNDR